MAKMLSLPLLILLVFPFECESFSAENPTDRRLLVLVDDLAIRSSHSLYFKFLESRGYVLEFRLADDPKLALQRYGHYLYDGLVIFSPSVQRFGGSLDQAAVLDFVDAGHDLILAADSYASDLIRGIASECGVDFDEDPDAVVIDHVGYAVSEIDGEHTLIAADDFIQSDVILGEKKIEAPVLFRGIGHSVNPASTLVLKVLSASPSAYSASPKTKLSTPSITGSTIALVSVVQVLNSFVINNCCYASRLLLFNFLDYSIFSLFLFFMSCVLLLFLSKLRSAYNLDHEGFGKLTLLLYYNIKSCIKFRCWRN
ncbi:Dolichyl-diphosphooligosaccharide--protein glycosyltransferase 48 kDa subunit [Dendrobium catenatum]|uniref:Dolichyl-diphosphooligosaccharide--protein glycosyltransferase 48 kDa subunit n=1 Tax=Dendrobium catenatum TaxID=906689 RepID=A0A2I0X3J5_9ASPA|nr:Dolichyl-diphosphooligosaccharide--protein glycosyltransferase 48 kDa subunit [Dendrobium catenatum]